MELKKTCRREAASAEAQQLKERLDKLEQARQKYLDLYADDLITRLSWPR